MSNIDNIRNSLVTEYYDNSVVLDYALAIEQFLSDVAIIYPYKNWIDGEIVAGPHVEKYWVKIILMYPYKKMPDPSGAEVLSKMGVKVSYKKNKFRQSVKIKTPEDLEPNNKPKMEEKPIWLIKLDIPKSLLRTKDIQDFESLTDDIDFNVIDQALTIDNLDVEEVLRN